MEATIRPARLPEDLPTVRALFRDYAAGLGVDLGFQGFEAELADLPGRYAAPAGAILLAWGDAGTALGCVAMRPLSGGLCEMKRLYLRPAARGLGLGRDLGLTILAAARAAGHRRMVLDTLDSMTPALTLYAGLGFAEIAPYYENPLTGVVYLGRDL